LNISSLTTGVYFIRVFGWSKKIVVDWVFYCKHILGRVTSNKDLG
jgi:hypothetical protein